MTRVLQDFGGTVWRVTEEDLRDVGLRVGETAIVFTDDKGRRRWTKGIPSTLPFIHLDELRLMLERAKAVPNG